MDTDSESLNYLVDLPNPYDLSSWVFMHAFKTREDARAWLREWCTPYATDEQCDLFITTVEASEES